MSLFLRTQQCNLGTCHLSSSTKYYSFFRLFYTGNVGNYITIFIMRWLVSYSDLCTTPKYLESARNGKQFDWRCQIGCTFYQYFLYSNDLILVGCRKMSLENRWVVSCTFIILLTANTRRECLALGVAFYSNYW